MANVDHVLLLLSCAFLFIVDTGFFDATNKTPGTPAMIHRSWTDLLASQVRANF